MSHIFWHDPFNWFTTATPGDRQKNLTRLVNERQTQGYSFWDWINFCDYYGAIIKHVSELVGSGIIPVTQEVSLAAETIWHDIERVEELDILVEKMPLSGRDADEVKRKAVVEEMADLESKVVRTFFATMLYSFPFVEDYKVPVANRNNFIHPVDYDSLGSFLVHVFRENIIRFQTGHSFPGRFETFEEWEVLLKQITSELNPSSNTPMGKDSLEVVVTNFTSLWD